MTGDRNLGDVLAELSPYLDNPPLPGSEEHLRFDELIAEVSHHRAVGAEHPLAEQIDQLGAKIDAFTRRRDEEHHAHDLVPGGQSITPMLGSDFPTPRARPLPDIG